MQCGCLMLILSLFLIGMGAQGSYVAVTNQKQRVIPYEKFAREKPGQGWFKITNCSYDLSEAYLLVKRSRKSGTETPEKLFIPVRPVSKAGEKARGRAVLLLMTDDANLISLYQELEPMAREAETVIDNPNAPPEQVKKVRDWLEHNRERIVFEGAVDGTVEFGLSAMINDSDKLTQIKPRLAQDYRVLKWRDKPDFMVALLMFFGGLALLVVTGFLFLGFGGKKG